MDGFLGLIDDFLDDLDSGKGLDSNLAEVYHHDQDNSTVLKYHEEFANDVLSALDPSTTNMQHEDKYELHGSIGEARHDDIAGNPEEDMQHWHKQTQPDTCAIVVQEFILDELTGRDFTENELHQEAIDNGWHIPSEGTPLKCMGNLLEAHGIKVEKSYDGDIDDIEKCLESGHKVMVAVNSDDIWNKGENSMYDRLSDLLGITEADHAIEVIGVDCSDSQHPMVILNDPGNRDGRGLEVSLDTFDKAWATSDRFMVSTNGMTDHASPAAGAVVDSIGWLGVDPKE